MHKSRRAIIAETIKDLFNAGFTAKQKAALKKVTACISESRLLDVIHNNICTISPRKPAGAGRVISNMCRDIRNEYVYMKITEGLAPNNVKYLNTILYNQNKFMACRLEKLRGCTNSLAATRNIVDMLLKIDISKHTHSAALRKLLNSEAKSKLIEESLTIVHRCRHAMSIITEKYGETTGDFSVEMLVTDSHHAGRFFVCKADMSEEINYMYSNPLKMQDMEVQFNVLGDTTAVRALNKARQMPFTLDAEYNKALLAIVDTPMFDKIVRGKSTDEASIKAKTLSMRQTIKAGIKFWEASGSGNVSFNYVADFRGRLSQLGGLSAVGHKAGKAMLRSGVKYPLGRDGYDNLLIALAGSMGKDKETFTVRLKWAQDNVARFTEIGGMLRVNPEAAFTFLHKEGADEIFSAAALCLELKRIQSKTCDLRDYQSNIFIGYDATSSAVQLVGLIMGNDILTEASNCRVGKNTEDKIHDAYMLIADCMDVAAPKLMDDESQEVIKMWLDFPQKIKRAMAKPMLMTRLYGSSFLTHKVSAEDIAIEKGILSAADTKKVQFFGKIIARLFNYAFNNEKGFNALRSYEAFVKEIAKAYVSVDKHVEWSVQDTQTEELQRIRSVYLKGDGQEYYYFTGDTKKYSLTYNLYLGNDCAVELDTKEKYVVDKRKAQSAVAPNFIHSHDALVLHRLVNSMDCPIRLTHDCFAVPAGRLTEMHQNVIDIYCDLFGDNRIPRIEKLQEECFKNTGILVDLPSEYNPKGIPTEEIRRAKYMVS